MGSIVITYQILVNEPTKLYVIEHLLYDRAGTIEIEKLWPIGVATYVCGVSYYAYTRLHQLGQSS